VKEVKIRSSFVTNSSSSSFIIIDASRGYEELSKFNIDWNLAYRVGEQGETEFGWQFDRYEDIHSRINFAYLQAVGDQEWQLMLEKVIKENSIVEFVDLIGLNGYIDHQSAACEGENVEMFNSEQALKDFIFGKGSYIQCGNDNC
jgi:hypothetical protein